MKKLIVLDLEGTLAESKAAVDAEMAPFLLKILKASVISGGDWSQFEMQVLRDLKS